MYCVYNNGLVVMWNYEVRKASPVESRGSGTPYLEFHGIYIITTLRGAQGSWRAGPIDQFKTMHSPWRKGNNIIW